MSYVPKVTTVITEDGNNYSLFDDELKEYDRMKQSLDAGAFKGWWTTFKKRKHIPEPTGKWKGYSKGWGEDEYEDYSGWSGSFKGSVKKVGKGLSSWWQGWGGNTGWYGSGTEQKLASALQAVIATTRIVDDGVPPMSVEWSSTELSATDLKNRRIIISPAPIRDKKTNDEDAIDVCTGFALHEASHAQYTIAVHEQLFKPTELEPPSVAGLLANVLEDNRIERLTSEEYPGFADYFPKSKDWLWASRLGMKEANPWTWDDDLGAKLNAIIVMVRWPHVIRTSEWTTENGKENVLAHPSFSPEISWWKEWDAEYQTGTTSLREAVEKGLDRLDTQDPKGMAERAKQDAAMTEGRKIGADLLKKLIEQLKGDLNIETGCSDGEQSDQLDSEEADEVRRMVEAKRHEEKVRMQDGRARPALFVSRPVENALSKREYIGKPSPVVARLRAALQFRPELPHYSDKLLKSGAIDEEELWRAGAKDYRVFERQVVEEYPNAQVGLLCDMSGSMCSSVQGQTKVKVAQQLAQLFISALTSMQGITPKVFGHTGDLRGNAEADLYVIWEPGDPLTRLGLISSEDHGNNYDGHAISWCVDELLGRGGPNDQRVLFVLSDGYPAGTNYGSYQAMDHMKAVSEDADKRGVVVVQVAIDSAMRPTEQSRMFKNWVQFDGVEKLPTQLAKMLGRLLNG